ncbi:unnamed protein product [Cuscuta epithymum]|uniref:Uncharacterized protein n=2 Tax=Cuscuta epithymum TaxID=186058 RepID=A0AAV0D130_9ASTE|nr:unnamed protein product [Cuscuta epithymum]
MGKKHHRFISPVIISFVVTLGLVSFTLCIVAEFKKSKKEDLRLAGEFCYLPRSLACGLAIAALVCFTGAQVIGSVLVVGRSFMSGERHKPMVVIFSLVLSWISYGVGLVFLGTTTSMSRSQQLGEGWLDGECYLVKNGVFTFCAILILFTLGSTLGSAIIIDTKEQQQHEVEQLGKKAHAQEISE